MYGPLDDWVEAGFDGRGNGMMGLLGSVVRPSEDQWGAGYIYKGRGWSGVVQWLPSLRWFNQAQVRHGLIPSPAEVGYV